MANINKIEIRKIDDKYLWEFSEQELIEFKKFLDKENIEVLTIDSPVGKKPIPYSRKVELFEIYLKICKIFNCKCMRIFSNLGDEKNRLLKAQCPQYGIPYINTSIDRERILSDILGRIDSLHRKNKDQNDISDEGR